MTTEAEDPEVLRLTREATEELRKLVESLDIEMDWIMDDWKRVPQHFQEISDFLHSHPGWYFHTFPAWHEFEDGSGDDIIAIYTSKPISHEDAEKIANLVYNRGAEWEYKG